MAEFEENNDPDKSAIIANALAEYFECPPEEIQVFLVCCERRNEEGNVSISSAWTLIPHWHLVGFVDELKMHIEQQRSQAALAEMLANNEEGGENNNG